MKSGQHYLYWVLMIVHRGCNLQSWSALSRVFVIHESGVNHNPDVEPVLVMNVHEMLATGS